MQKNRCRSFLIKTGCVVLSFMMITLLAGPMNINAAEDVQPDASVQKSEVESTFPTNVSEMIEGDSEDVESTSDEETVSDQEIDTEPTSDTEPASDTEPDDTNPQDTPAAEPKNGVVIEDGVYHYYINDIMQQWLITTESGDRYYAGADGELARNEVIRFSDSNIGWLYFGDDG